MRFHTLNIFCMASMLVPQQELGHGTLQQSGHALEKLTEKLDTFMKHIKLFDGMELTEKLDTSLKHIKLFPMKDGRLPRAGLSFICGPLLAFSPSRISFPDYTTVFLQKRENSNISLFLYNCKRLQKDCPFGVDPRSRPWPRGAVPL